MEFFGCRVKPLHELIAGFPDVEYVLHVAHAAKALVQIDNALDVVRVGSALDESGPNDGVIRIRLFKFKASVAETHRHHDRFAISEEIRFGTRRRKAHQVEYRFFLVLRPQALAFDVCATSSQDVHAGDGKPDEDCDDRQKRRYDKEHALAHYEPLDDFRKCGHCGFIPKSTPSLCPYFRNFRDTGSERWFFEQTAPSR